MIAALGRSWWLSVLRGLLACAFAATALAWPSPAAPSLVLLFGAWVVLDAVLAFTTAAHRAGEGAHRVLVLVAIAGVAVGAVALTWPNLPLPVLSLLVALWAVVTGLLEVTAALKLRRQLGGELFYATGGAASVLLGALVLAAPWLGAAPLRWLGAAYALAAGVVLVALGLRWRRPVDAAPRAV